MAWRQKALVSLSVLLAATPATRPAFAQVCASARPSYGSAETAFYDSPSGLARVHYALSGSHAPPSTSTEDPAVPDAVLVAAQAAEDALATYAALGYEAPLTDGDSPCSDNGGSDALDVYLLHFSAADGQAQRDHCQAGTPQHCAGFVLVENDFRGGGYASTAEGLRTVVPHEVFHLVQNAYDADVERWWAEGSAQWAAKQVYPDLRDLERFLPAYFEVPWRPLSVPPPGIITNFLYATAIWPTFLHERFDADIVREVFEQLDGVQQALPAADAVLRARGSTLADEFLQFAAYNAATGARAPELGGYVGARDYPEVPLAELTNGSVTDAASGLGAFYYAVPASSSELRLEADPERVQALLLPLEDGKANLRAAIPLPARVDGEAILVVAARSVSRTNAVFTIMPSAPAAEGGGGPESSGCALRPARSSRPLSLGASLLSLLGGLGRRRSALRRKDRV